MCEDINDIPNGASYRVIQSVVKSAAKDILEMGGCQLGEFRLLIIIQIAILSGFLVCPHPFLHQIMYPVKDRASYQHLILEGIEPDDFDFVMDTICCKMGWHISRNLVETGLCESIEQRRELVYDILIFGMDLYCLNEEGQRIVKEWGSREWKIP